VPAHGHLIDEHDIAWMIADHAEQRRLCGRLERMADGLPDRPLSGEAAELRAALRSFPVRHFAAEAELFSWLAKQSSSIWADKVVHEIVRSHAVDAMHADDVAAELEHIDTAHIGQLSYMLRCFFDGCRRAIAFEELALLKMGGDRLTPTARSAVIASLGSR